MLPTPRPRAPRSPAAPFALALLGAFLGPGLASCADTRSEPGWVSLVHQRDPLALEPDETIELGTIEGRRVSLLHEGDEAWIQTALGRADWTLDERRGVWQTPVHARGLGMPRDGSHNERLVSSEGAFRYRSRAQIDAGGPNNFPPGHFHVTQPPNPRAKSATLLLRLPPNEAPPALSLLRVYAGPRSGSEARVDGNRFTGDALRVWPGQRVAYELDLAPGRALRFATVAEPGVRAPSTNASSVRFLVRLDDEVLFEHRVPDVSAPVQTWHAVELPADGRSAARLVFEVEGAFAHTAFFDPVIGPAEVGTYGERPWGPARPDIVFFLADTFRADNLTAYGNELPLTPNIDRVAEASLLFENAWSVATFTMPAHSALFSGIFARQAAATSTLSALPEEIETIAEHLHRAGYRTAAVTDAVVVSRKNNLDQGFESFDEQHGTLEETIARANAILDADDGRPLFLFLQTYRTHTPYGVTQETFDQHGQRLKIDRPYQAAHDGLVALGRRVGLEGNILNDLRKAAKAFYVELYEEPGADPSDVREYEGLIASMRALYLGTVADLDRGFGPFHAGLERRGLLDSGYFVFTSDHGEAFNEHDKVFHGGKVWEETTRIPMFLSGPGIRPGRVARSVSLLDLTPTLAEMAGIPGSDGWRGSSLLSPPTDVEGRPIFVFENQEHESSTVAIIEGRRKVIAYEDVDRLEAGDVFAAFDLEVDPLERNDLSESEPWPARQAARLGGPAAALMQPLYGSEAGEVDEERQAQLEALGYGGG